MTFDRYTTLTAVIKPTNATHGMTTQARLIEYLEQEMGLSEQAIALAVRQAGALPNLLPIALWKYGLVTTEQLDQIFDWLETLQPSQNLV